MHGECKIPLVASGQGHKAKSRTLWKEPPDLDLASHNKPIGFVSCTERLISDLVISIYIDGADR